MAEPSDVEALYREWARGEGRTGAERELVCEAWAEGVDLCFTWVSEGRRKRVTRADLARWGADAETVRAAVHARTSSAVGAEQFTVHEVEGVTGRYWTRTEADGLDAAALLHPERLEAALGGRPVVAVPSDRALVAWLPGEDELDRIVAIGVRRMMEASDHPVSARVYRWDGTAWQVWGEAVERRE